MNLIDIAKIRLLNQHVGLKRWTSAQELVGHMGALQAQDYEMVKWAMGVRLPGSTKQDIEKAITDGSVIRTHLLRPTWHLVSVNNLRWMLELTAPRVKMAMRHRHNHLGLTKQRIRKSNNTITDVLAKNGHLPRKELVAELEKAGFENKDNMASHLLLRAELDGFICSGPTKQKKYTYALLDNRVPESKSLTKEEALERLARTYFSSHGPATLEDFVWWSGLTKTTARQALEMISSGFRSAHIASKEYWFNDTQPLGIDPEPAHLLPAYDEFIISYKSRDKIIPDDEKRKKAILNNGIFRPTIIYEGQAIGIWKGSVKNKAVLVKLDFFDAPAKIVKSKVEIAAERFAAFFGKKVEIASV